MNLAALYALPLLIVCENNKYAANTEIENATFGRAELLPKVEAMGIPGKIVDGYDLPAFRELGTAAEDVRSGQGPRYLEVMTYRYCAHVGPQSDDYLGYRTADEIAE